MTTISAELEHEFEHELAGGGGSTAIEGPRVREGEAFFNHLATMADRSGRSQTLRRIALAAARSAYRGAVAARPSAVIQGEGEAEAEHELEFELAAAMVKPPSQCLPQLEHFGHAAAEAETEQEAAEHFLPLIPLPAKLLLPMAAKALPFALKAGGAMVKKFAPKLMSKVVPQLTRGVGNLARTLYRAPATRNLLRVVPRIGLRTVAQVAQRVARGQRINASQAGRILARNAARMLGSPRRVVTIYRRSRALDRRHHLRARRAVGAPSATMRVVAPQATGWTPGPVYTAPGIGRALGVAPAVACGPCPTCGPRACPTCGR